MSFLWSLQTLILYRDSGKKMVLLFESNMYRERSCSKDTARVANLGICSFSPSALVGVKPSSPCLAEALSRNLPHFLMGTCQVLCHGLLPAVTRNCLLCPSRVAIGLGHITFSPPRLPTCTWSGRLWKGTGFLQLHLLGSLRLYSSPEDAPEALPVTHWGSTWICRMCRNLTSIESSEIYSRFFRVLVPGSVLLKWVSEKCITNICRQRLRPLEIYRCYSKQTKKSPWTRWLDNFWQLMTY